MAIDSVQAFKHLVERGTVSPNAVFPEIAVLAQSERWQTREGAATALVRISKKQPEAVVAQAQEWAHDVSSNLRRLASEGLRGVVRINPSAVLPVLELLRSDSNPYVKKSVANLLRDASVKHTAFVLQTCKRWALSPDPHTKWIVRHGLKKLIQARPLEVAAVLEPS